MLGTLYIVATPIGNLEDVTLRSISILSDTDIILAEDTRVTKKLLDLVVSKWSFAVKEGKDRKKKTKIQKIISYHQHSGETKKLEILNYLLSGFDIALVTDAGTPGISDPGGELIEYLLSYQKDLKIIPVPGASAVQTLLSVSGLKCSKYLFLGFLPKKKLGKLLKTIKETKQTFVYFDSPHRVLKNLITIEKALGSYHKVVVGREMTKLHESIYRGTIREVISTLESEDARGEVTVVVEY